MFHSVNKLQRLDGLSTCHRLKELYLRKNLINDFNELWHLRDLRKLRILWLSENPISNHPHYRQMVVGMLPWVQKLDNIGMSGIR